MKDLSCCVFFGKGAFTTAAIFSGVARMPESVSSL